MGRALFGSGNIFSFLAAASNRWFLGNSDAGSRARTRLWDGSQSAVNESGAGWDQTNIAASSWAAAVQRVCKNNTTATTSFDGDMNIAYIGVGTALQPSGAIRNAVLLLILPTDAALQSSTQWHNY